MSCLLCSYLMFFLLPQSNELFIRQQENLRNDFFAKLSEVSKGDSKENVRRLVGEPKRVVTREEVRVGGYEIWSFGTNSDDPFATLGQVHFDRDGRANSIWGGARKPNVFDGINESEVRDALRLINKMPTANGKQWNPALVTKIVNALHSTGEKNAPRLIDEYARITPLSSESNQKIQLLLRVLYDVPSDLDSFPDPNIVHSIYGKPQDPTLAPRYPVLVLNDVPLLIAWVYSHSGHPSHKTVETIEWYKANGQWRKHPLDERKLSGSETEKLSKQVDDVLAKYLEGKAKEVVSKIVKQQLEQTADK